MSDIDFATTDSPSSGKQYTCHARGCRLKGQQMRKWYLLIATAWLLQVASWFLPAVTGFLGSRLDHGIAGWEVFLAETCAFRPCADASADPWYGTAISAAGVITTVLFVLASPWIVWRASRKIRRAAAFVAGAAFVVNSQWYLFYAPVRSDLGVGYFLWCSSFCLLAIGLFILAGSKSEFESRQRSYNDPAGRNGSGNCGDATMPRDIPVGSSRR